MFTHYGNQCRNPLNAGLKNNMATGKVSPNRSVKPKMSRAHHAFIAYPSEPRLIPEAIRDAIDLSQTSRLRLLPWERVPIIGLKLDDLIREKIAGCDVLLADITYPNFNVYYEIGYAIAHDTPIIPLVNTSITDAVKNAQRIGLFDTTGWLTYDNSNELIYRLNDWQNVSWTDKLRKDKDHAQPLFVLDTAVKSNYRNYVYSAITHSQVEMRSFDPSANPRLTAAHAIGEISSSAGAILMLLDPRMAGAEENNLRAGFLAGLAHGFEIDPLIIQFDNGPAPTDFRDFVRNSNRRVETENHVSEYCSQVLVRNQRSSKRARKYTLGLLNKIDLGASAAENEIQQLAEYFVSTAEFARAQRSDSALIIGRKGSGKSAIAVRAAAEAQRDRGNLVLDLRPAAHNLSDLREQLLGTVGQGLFDHTIASFWQYVLLLEMILAARERALKEAKRNYPLQERIRKLEDEFNLTDEFLAGDFTSRLEATVESVLTVLAGSPTPEEVREQITNSMYESVIPSLRAAFLDLRDFYQDVYILLDDLDKGWPPRKLEPYDVKTIRHLIEVLKRIQRDFRRKDINVRYMMFLRSDVYDTLVEQTADRGKDAVIKVDWSDREQLSHLLRERVLTSFDSETGDEAWEAFNPKMPDGRNAIDHLIDAALYRPRFLIEVAERVLSFAINRGHSFVDERDVENALEQMSLYLVSDFAYEMRNVAGTPEDIFYAFIGTSGLLTHEEVTQKISARWPTIEHESVLDLLVWYGFLGIVSAADKAVFIFDRAYDFRRLLAERPTDPCERLYAVNGAFTRGLKES